MNARKRTHTHTHRTNGFVHSLPRPGVCSLDREQAQTEVLTYPLQVPFTQHKVQCMEIHWHIGTTIDSNIPCIVTNCVFLHKFYLPRT